jgi:hypothetical protein
MPGSTNGSFIPKRNGDKNSKSGEKRQVFVGTFIVKILFFAILLAAAGVFVYEKKLSNDLDAEVTNLNNAISIFDEEKLARVIEVDNRINQVKLRLSNTSSMAALLDAIEKSTIGTSQITELDLKREDDSNYTLQSVIKTDSFDSVLFQREILSRNNILSVSDITELALENVPPNNGLYDRSAVVGETSAPRVTFKAILSVDTEKIRHQAFNATVSAVEDVQITPVVVENQASSSTRESIDSVNQEQL